MSTNDKQTKNTGTIALWPKIEQIKLEILQSLGGLYDGLALPAPGITTPWLTYTYTIYVSCFHPLLFLSPYLPEISSFLD